MTFGARLDQALSARGSLCVGIDPHPALLRDWGLPDDASGLERFALTCVSAIGDHAAVMKPQSAFFERFGAAGITVLERTVRLARDAGALVILDVKRGDIGSTMTAYADAYLAPGAPLGVDAITLNPYLGVGALEPAFELTTQHQVGAFVLGLTSNPEGPRMQHAIVADGRSVAQLVVDELADRNVGAAPFGSLGIVVGATIGTAAVDLRGLHGPVLMPGVGVGQGGTAEDVRRIAGTLLPAVVPSVSREVLRRGPDVKSLRDASRRLIDAFAFLRA
jgi:orotidine-5'-phosphate decarboxylase